MADDYILRMTWRDQGTAVVHAVEFDLATFEPSKARDDVLRRPPASMRVIRTDVRTVCGEAIPRHQVVERDQPVTCEACLSEDGGPAVEWAERFLDARSRAVTA